jgi:hypothetical protein
LAGDGESTRKLAAQATTTTKPFIPKQVGGRLEMKNLTKDNKRKEPKIKILAHELLASTLSYLMLAP